MSAIDSGDSDGGWRRNPLVGGIAAAVVLVVLISAISRCNCGGSRVYSPIEGDKVTMVCTSPQCGEVYKVSAADVGLEGEFDLDEFQARATRTPCPKCGSTKSVVATLCPHCGKPFAAPTTGLAKDIECPHCGKGLLER